MVGNDIIRLSCEVLAAGSRLCTKAGERVRNPGIKKLILSLAENEKENASRVAEWGETLPGTVHHREFMFDARRFSSVDAIEAAHDDQQILLRLIEEKTRLAALFAAVAESLAAGDDGVIFQKLSEDEIKQRALLQDRYDLLGLR